MIERHHVFCLAIGGVHFLPGDTVNVPNIIMLEKSVHANLHRVLNIPYEYIRIFRMKYELYHIKDIDYYTDLNKLQTMYFANLKLLSKELQIAHVYSVKQQIVIFAKLFSYTGCLHLNATFMDDVSAFNFYLGIYHKIFIYRTTKYLVK
jgi:hypothetical protein